MGKKIFLGMFSVLLVWWIWPMVDPHWEQDRCSFGSVSNEEYRVMLKEAKQQRVNKWGKIRVKGSYADGGSKEDLITKDLMRRVLNLSNRFETIDGKIAAMHAVLRANGANYTSARKYSEHVKSSSRYRYVVPAWKWEKYDLNTIGRPISNLISRWTIVSVGWKRDFTLNTESLDYIALTPVGLMAASVGYDGLNCPEIFY